MDATLPTSLTLVSTLNIAYVIMFLLVFPALMVFLSPRAHESSGIEKFAAGETAATILSVEVESEQTKLAGSSLTIA